MPLLRARTHFAVGHRHVRPNDLVDSTDPIVSGREHLFGPVEATNVEAATAAPGERRTVTRPHVCDACGFEAKTKAGLGAHRRSHDS